MNAKLLADLDEEIAKRRAELEALENTRAVLQGSTPVLSHARPVNGHAMSAKAPVGSLKKAIIAALGDGASLGRAEIIQRLKTQGYAYSLEPMHVSKTLIGLRKTKKVKAEGSNNSQQYRLP